MAKLSFFLQEWGSGDRPLAYYLFDGTLLAQRGWSRVIIGLCAKIMQFCSNHDTNVEHVQWKPIKCHCTTWMPLRPIHCHSPQIWPKFTNWQPLCQLFPTLPLECHWVFFSATRPCLCKRWACEARGQNWSKTKVIIGLDPPA